MKYERKTTPMTHQAEELDAHATDETRGLLWGMGTGKTFTVIESAVQLFEQGKINGLLVVAPNGVHGNWIYDELPKHLPEGVRLHSLEWESKKAKNKGFQQDLDFLTNEHKGLSVFALNYDAFQRKGSKALAAAKRFLEARSCMAVLDESQRIKTPDAVRTRALCRLGRSFTTGNKLVSDVCTYRRILSGTPITQDPMDIYSQCKFLDWHFWRQERTSDEGNPLPVFASYSSFKNYFGIYVTMFQVNGEWKKDSEVDQREKRSATGRFESVVAFRNLEQLQEIIMQHCSRVVKEDVLDLPPKTYSKRYFDMTADQRKLYLKVKNEFMAFLDSGEIVTAPLMITRLLRLQQISCGYVPTDGDDETMHYMSENPRMSCLLDCLQDVAGKVIIFARFRQDINQICAELGDLAVRYDGAVEYEQRMVNRRRFQDPEDPVRFFVANPAVASTGLTLTQATTVIYFSNNFKLEDRLQSEDRAHRIGQTKSVHYIDLIAKGSVDARIVKALRKKQDIASQVTGDEIREWL